MSAKYLKALKARADAAKHERKHGHRVRDKYGAEVRAGDLIHAHYPGLEASYHGRVVRCHPGRVDFRETDSQHLRSVRPGWIAYDWDQLDMKGSNQ